MLSCLNSGRALRKLQISHMIFEIACLTFTSGAFLLLPMCGLVVSMFNKFPLSLIMIFPRMYFSLRIFALP